MGNNGEVPDVAEITHAGIYLVLKKGASLQELGLNMKLNPRIPAGLKPRLIEWNPQGKKALLTITVNQYGRRGSRRYLQGSLSKYR